MQPEPSDTVSPKNPSTCPINAPQIDAEPREVEGIREQCISIHPSILLIQQRDADKPRVSPRLGCTLDGMRKYVRQMQQLTDQT